MNIFNEEVINNRNPEKVKVTVSCHDTVISRSMKVADQMKLLSRLPQDPTQTANLHHSLDIVVNMIYDLKVNVNTEDGLAMVQPVSLSILKTDKQVLIDRALYGFSSMIHRWEFREGYSIKDCTANPFIKAGLQCLM